MSEDSEDEVYKILNQLPDDLKEKLSTGADGQEEFIKWHAINFQQTMHGHPDAEFVIIIHDADTAKFLVYTNINTLMHAVGLTEAASYVLTEKCFEPTTEAESDTDDG